MSVFLLWRDAYLCPCKLSRWSDVEDSEMFKTATAQKSYLFKEKSFWINSLATTCPDIMWNSIIQIKERIRRGPSFLCAIAFSFIFMCKWILKQRHFWPLANSEGTRWYIIWRFVRSWLLAYVHHTPNIDGNNKEGSFKFMARWLFAVAFQCTCMCVYIHNEL